MAQHPSGSTRRPADDGFSRLLHRWGVFAYRHRLAVLIVPLLLVVACLPLLPSVGDRLSPGGWLPPGSEAVRVDHRLDAAFGRHTTAHYLLFSDPGGQLLATDTAFRREVERVVAPLRRAPSVTAIHTWGTTTEPILQELLIADDGRQSLAVVMVDQDVKEAAVTVPTLRETLTSDLLDVQIGGWPATTADFRELTSTDLRRAEVLSLPLTVLVLLAVFGGVLLAGLPLMTTLLALIPTLAIVSFMSRYIETSLFTINVVVMIGLAVGIDYALILVSRYREELASRIGPEAMGTTLATAGRTVIVSGMAVAIGLLGLLAFGAEAATATAIAASAVVFLGVLVSLTVLPASLAILGDRARGRMSVWGRMADAVTRRLGQLTAASRGYLDRNPLPALIASCAVLLLLAAPVLAMRPEPPGMTVLPQSQPSRQMYDTARSDFSASTLSPITLIVEPRNERPMTNARNLNDLQAFVEALGDIDGVHSVTSVWSFLPAGIGSSLLSGGIRVDAEIGAIVRPYLTAEAAVVEVNLHAEPGSDAAKAILATIRTEHLRLSDGAFTVTAGGETATSVDLIDHLAHRLPWTLGLVTLATAVVLAIQFRSVLLPLKAIALNLLSLAASFGALIWIFQEGHLAGLLGFEPLGYTIVIVPVLMFCFMFGLSMDYEVIMLSRIRETWLDTGDNARAVAEGLRGSARIVTSAALVMLIVFASFGASELQVIKQIGLGLAIAVFVDATLIRLVALPAAMQLMGRWNWWLPAFRRRPALPPPVPEAPARLP